MMGLENTGDIPFRYVYLHGLIRDENRAKMSKSRGNVIDPVQSIEQYGTDALRFALSTGNSPGNDMLLGAAKLEGSRNFTNKLWNAARFVIGNLGEEGIAAPAAGLPAEDRWIMSRLNRLVADMGAGDAPSGHDQRTSRPPGVGRDPSHDHDRHPFRVSPSGNTTRCGGMDRGLAR